jgi:CubicO group peptidase (beta-lactamase class C family)
VKTILINLALAGVALGTVVLIPCAVAQSSANSAVLPDSEIRQILVDRIDKERQSVGIVVGVIEPAGRRVVAYGNLDQGDKRPLDGDTIFEIGSVTSWQTWCSGAKLH